MATQAGPGENRDTARPAGHHPAPAAPAASVHVPGQADCDLATATMPGRPTASRLGASGLTCG